jgi:hypothetical protein
MTLIKTISVIARGLADSKTIITAARRFLTGPMH